jgi:hypothetical protein
VKIYAKRFMYGFGDDVIQFYVPSHILFRMVFKEEEETYEEQRREQLNNELVRIQRTNFIHFGVLCMLPVFMLVLVVITSFRQSGTCEGYETYTCDFEQKEFMNAFVSRCICTAIEVNGYV